VTPAAAALIRVDSIKLTVYYTQEIDRGTIPGNLPSGLIAVNVDGPVAIVVGAAGRIFTSTDQGANWTARTSGVSEDLYAIAHDGSQYIVTGQNGTILTSGDGITWTRQSSPTGQHLYGLLYSKARGKLIAVGSNQEALYGTGVSTWIPKATFNDPYEVPA